jgi:hypothetical protein
LVTSVASVRKIILPSSLCRAYNNIGRTLETPQKTDLEEEEWVNKVYKPFSTRKSTQKIFLERSAPLPTDREHWHSLGLFGGVL